MPLLSWFSKKPSNEDYEQVLASLALSIQKRQTKLSEIRLRERRATLLVTSWAFAAWAGYVALWWAGIVGRGRRRGALWGVPVVLGPVAILFTRRIVQLWYARKGNAEEKTLKKLLVEQRNKIEDIKKKTNYYATKNLLDRYDEGPVRGQNKAGDAPKPQRIPPAPIQSHPQPQGKPKTSIQGQVAPQTPARGGPQGQPYSPVLPPLPAPQKRWYDKLADALLGDDTASTGPATSRYALICERCFSHNGLVREEQWEDAQYLCPKCGHFNRSARSRKAGLTSPTTPQSAMSPSNIPLSHSTLSQNFLSASAGPSPSQISTQGITSPSSPSHVQQSPTSSPAPRPEPSPNLPLSASTVIVEKHDVEDQGQETTGYDVKGAGEGKTDKIVHMEVDS